MQEHHRAIRVCGLFGNPVAHSLSPAMHNAAFQALGLPWMYVPFQIEQQNLEAAVRGIKALGMVGVNVTVPHKQAVIPYLDFLSAEATLIGAVNTIINDKGVLRGYNTDGTGFIRFLQEELKCKVSGSRALLLGAGGAARAVAVALALNGMHEISILNRSLDKARAVAKCVQQTGCICQVLENPKEKELALVLGQTDFIVQTTSIGMHPCEKESPVFPYHLLDAAHTVVDIVYNPLQTAFMQQCAQQGATVYGGLGMLLYQGVQAFELWTNIPAPVACMRTVLQKGMI